MGADLSIGYERTDVFTSGIIAETFASFDMGAAAYNNDSTATQLATYVNPHLGATLRWPLISGSAGGTIHTIEPIIQLGASAGYDTGVVNEDSLLTEFDQSNLFEPVQFAGTNARSYGNFAAMGLKWNASTQGGQHYDVLLGHRWTTDTAYLTPSSGLATQKSDLLVSASAQFSDTIRIDHRSIWDMSGQSSKFDTKLAWTKGDHQISLAQSYLSSDLSENRSSDISLIRFQNGYQINPEWRTDFDFWYDVAAQAPKTAKLTAKFENECLRADLSLSHNFGSSVNVTPDISLEVQMIGFGARGKTRHKTCN